MARRKIREYDAKRLVFSNMGIDFRAVLVDECTNLDELASKHPWLSGKLVVKPDQLFGKRKKHGLVLSNADFNGAKSFINRHMNSEVTIGGITDRLTHFLIEPFVPHNDEYYVAVMSERDGDIILFSSRGGTDVENNWDHIKKLFIPTLSNIEEGSLSSMIDVPEEKRKKLISFIMSLHRTFVDLDFTYLEINPLVFDDRKLVPLDLVSELDDSAHFRNIKAWGNLEFPQPFGRKIHKEEEHIKSIDASSGASLKLTILNPSGKIWTMVAGGGASVIYADTIADLGMGNQLANYGEYSGNPTAQETYEYAKTILDLMTRDEKKGKVLIIGGAIANFTDVAATFRGIIKAIHEYGEKLKKNEASIFVRRGGPNYLEGLKNIKQAADEEGIPIEVYGPETHMTRIVALAVNKMKGEK